MCNFSGIKRSIASAWLTLSPMKKNKKGMRNAGFWQISFLPCDITEKWSQTAPRGLVFFISEDSKETKKRGGGKKRSKRKGNYPGQYLRAIAGQFPRAIFLGQFPSQG